MELKQLTITEVLDYANQESEFQIFGYSGSGFRLGKKVEPKHLWTPLRVSRDLYEINVLIRVPILLLPPHLLHLLEV